MAELAPANYDSGKSKRIHRVAAWVIVVLLMCEVEVYQVKASREA